MDMQSFLNHAKTLQNELVKNRQYVHAHAETGFDLDKTCAFVKGKLEELSLTPAPCGKSGLIALIEGEKPSKTEKCFLLRADMDALPIPEQTPLSFASQNGNMHACGHDMHTAMLLGAAKLLTERKAEFSGCVKLMFQPAEEILSGAKDMIEQGVLKKPDVQSAVSFHVMTGVDLPQGALLIPGEGISAPGADYFQILVQGKGCHGSAPQEGVDALSCACRILLALQEISARETAFSERAVLTIGKLRAGTAGNAVADGAEMEGTLRTYEQTTQERIKKRIVQIAEQIAKAFRASAEVKFTSSCPPLKNDGALCKNVETWAKTLFNADMVRTFQDFGNSIKSAASEDFAYISQEIPSIVVAINANKNGLPLHHPKVEFDEGALWIGSAAMAYFAIQWLESR